MSDLIYHYTSADGLLGILKSNHLRMTNVMFLNDSRELSHGLDVLFDQVIHPISQLGKDYKASSDGLMTVLDAFIEQLKESCPFFTASFCRDGDKLRQWTSYCPNGGYSIGFNRAYIDDSPEQITFGDVLYNDTPNNSDVTGVFMELFSLTDELKEAIQENRTSEIHNIWVPKLEKQAEEISKLALFHKDKNFEDEEEIRAHFKDDIQKPDKDFETDFYVKNNLIFPFKKLRFELKAIEEIVISPMVNQDLAESSLLALKKQLDYDFSISKSTISLRTL